MREYPVPYPLVIGRLRAGDWSSSVPDLLVADGRLGLRIEEDPGGRPPSAGGHGRRGQRPGSVPPRPPARGALVRRPVRRWAPPGRPRPPRAGPARARRRHRRTAAAGAGAPYGSDLRFYAAEGIPTLHYGPGDVRLAHGPDEAVEVDEIVRVTETLLLATLRACGTLD
ncbi:MAG TPA: M20/M25/M40 family metallo-hydrolase [Blastococcus sp.]|nr:M20/M25/M40 family metallo-hydrolase [Blastococcus sp.]